ncbi:hypothetical protein E4U55_000942 [Claviceps digitariae]|nr:hypothetical protein E4U55_000942 [Claviceps digitariae]
MMLLFLQSSFANVALVLLSSHASRGQALRPPSLDPVSAIRSPDAAFAQQPLLHLGGNGPWFEGPNFHAIPLTLDEGCEVDQAAYVLRHGSRYPDQGAYSGWLDMIDRVGAVDKFWNCPLSFLRSWDAPLSHPDVQVGQLSPTGYKELYDLGYTLRTRYPKLYNEGQDFHVWANNYTRVLQSAQAFLRGYIGANSSLHGRIVSVTSHGMPAHLGDTLAPSDMCPSFRDESAHQQNVWRSQWLPDFIKRQSEFISGTLELDDSQWADFPYICGFESQITGFLSPFCDTFTHTELMQYEYLQDLRYYYGLGPAANVSSKMMVPFLTAMMGMFQHGPGIRGNNTIQGTDFPVPDLLTSFLNDGQLNQLVVASGIFDQEPPLPAEHIPKHRLWRSSRISPMRGTIAFERLHCTMTVAPPETINSTSMNQQKVPSTAPAGTQDRNGTFVRILLNNAVYPVPSCQNGPGRSCPLGEYLAYLTRKLEQNGNFADICNATDPATPRVVLGASFFTNLAQTHVQVLQA